MINIINFFSDSSKLCCNFNQNTKYEKEILLKKTISLKKTNLQDAIETPKKKTSFTNQLEDKNLTIRKEEKVKSAGKSYHKYLRDSKTSDSLNNKKKKNLPKKETNYWSVYEDELLLDCFKKFGKNWTEISKRIPNRTENQCSLRLRRLIPDIKIRNTWTPLEDKHLLELINLFGQNWQKISANMKNRVGKQVRERFIFF